MERHFLSVPVWWLTRLEALPVHPYLITHLWGGTLCLLSSDDSLMERHFLSLPVWWLTHVVALPVFSLSDDSLIERHFLYVPALWLTCGGTLPFFPFLMAHLWSGIYCLPLFDDSVIELHFLSDDSLVNWSFLSASVWWLPLGVALAVSPCLMNHSLSGTSCLPLSEDSLV